MSSWILQPTPRDWQKEALAAWNSTGHKGVAAIVTGAGKTVFAEMCIDSFRSSDGDAQTTIVVPTLALLDQWVVSLTEELRVPADDIATYSGEGASASPAAINVMVINTARRHAERVSLNARRTLLVVDECHRAASAENSKALRGSYSATLGLSATPRRDYDELFEDVVQPALGPVIYEYDYNRARADGVIAPFNLRNVEVELDADERRDYDAYTRRLAILLRRHNKGEDVENAMKRALRERASVSANAKMRIPVAVRLVESLGAKHCVVFHERISAAEAIASLLRSRGASVATYHSELGPEIRRDNLRLFRRGLFDVLVSCRALDEGVNIPEASLAVVASSTASTRQRIQRLGRVLRPASGKSAATIVTLFATDVERRRLEEEEQRLEGADEIVWMKAS
jgi:superfamily II DNA or RNA helicase